MKFRENLLVNTSIFQGQSEELISFSDFLPGMSTNVLQSANKLDI